MKTSFPVFVELSGKSILKWYGFPLCYDHCKTTFLLVRSYCRPQWGQSSGPGLNPMIQAPCAITSASCKNNRRSRLASKAAQSLSLDPVSSSARAQLTFATVCSHSQASDLSIRRSSFSPVLQPQPDTLLLLSGPQASVYSSPSAVWDNDGQIQPTVK